MLLAPVVIHDRSQVLTASRRTRVMSPRTRALLRGWLIAGTLLWLLVPALRGGVTLGYTAAFWLIAAPLVDLAWLQREDIAGRFNAIRSSWLRRKRAVRGATRLPRQRGGSRGASSGDAEKSYSV